MLPPVLGSAVRVLVVDDNESVRAAVVALLERSHDIVVCGATASLSDAAVEAHSPDVVLVDLHLRGEGCIAASRLIVRQRPETRVVLLTGASDEEAFVASLLAGASAYLTKQIRGTDVAGTVRSVAEGRRLLDAEQLAGVLRRLGWDENRVSAQDLELLRLLAAGRPEDEIEQALGVAGDALDRRLVELAEELIGARLRAPAVVTTTNGGQKAWF